jgi:hypothetical protein
MLIQRTLRIKGGTSRKVSMMDKPRKKKEVCWVQITVNGLPKLILSKPTVENKENYNVLPHNYGYSF